MRIVFYLAAVIAVFSTVMVITRYNAIHALLYLVVSLLSVAIIFYISGAPFIAAFEVIIYAGAIMVLFIFVVMMLNLGPKSVEQEKEWLQPGIWVIPSILTFILFIEFLIVTLKINLDNGDIGVIYPKQVGVALFSRYMLGVELAGMLLMAGIIGAYHLGRGERRILHRYLEKKENDE